MKSVCKYCGNNRLIRWGGRRRYCGLCDRSFRVTLAGRKALKNRDMYLLDRSTYRRIGNKKKYSAAGIMYLVQKEIAPMPTPADWLKKIYIKLPVSWSLTQNTYRLWERITASSWLTIPTLV